jgi:hypothetical protein
MIRIRHIFVCFRFDSEYYSTRAAQGVPPSTFWLAEPLALFDPKSKPRFSHPQNKAVPSYLLSTVVDWQPIVRPPKCVCGRYTLGATISSAATMVHPSPFLSLASQRRFRQRRHMRLGAAGGTPTCAWRSSAAGTTTTTNASTAHHHDSTGPNAKPPAISVMGRTAAATAAVIDQKLSSRQKKKERLTMIVELAPEEAELFGDAAGVKEPSQLLGFGTRTSGGGGDGATVVHGDMIEPGNSTPSSKKRTAWIWWSGHFSE